MNKLSLNNKQEKSSQKILKENQVAVIKVIGILIEEGEKQGITFSSNVIWIFFKASINGKDKMDINYATGIITSIINDSSENTVKTIKSIIKKLSALPSIKRLKYDYLIIDLNTYIDSINVSEEKKNLSKTFENFGISDKFQEFYNSIFKGIELGESYSLVTHVNGKIDIDQIAPTNVLFGNLWERSVTEIMHYTRLYIEEKLSTIQKNLNENELLKDFKISDVLEKIEFVGGIENINDVYSERTLLILESIVMDECIHFLDENEEFKNLDTISKEIVKDILKEILISLNRISKREIVLKLFEGFDIRGNVLILCFSGKLTENRHIRNILDSLDFSDIYEKTGYRIDLKFEK